jgi:Uma2 family endonuclease
VAINSAREKLLTFQKAREEGEEVEEEEEEGYTGTREIIIKENVSLEKYLQYRENNAISSVRMYLNNGNIIIYEIPSLVHATAAGRIAILMGRWNDRDFDYGIDGTVILGQNTAKETDSWVRPIHRPDPPPGSGLGANKIDRAYPTMMIEVGFSQSFPDFHRKAALYFGPRTTIQIVLAIKIFGVRTNPNTNTSTIALIAALYLRTSATPLIPTSVISFGTADPDTNTVNNIINQMGVPPGSFTGVGRPDPNNNNINFPPCNAANLPDYQMNIPGPELYNGVPANNLPVGFAAGFNLDLWEIQNVIRRELRI